MIPQLKNLQYTHSSNFFLIAGPCVVENEDNPFEIAEHLVQLSKRYEIPLIFKASYKKANRSKRDSFTGIGDLKALELIQKIGQTYQIPTLTDFHTEEEARLAAQYVDVLQVPAFLCRQTDLLVAAAQTGACINIKKGQFLAPEQMQFAVEKVQHAGGTQVMLTDRGTFLGYSDLVVDFRSIPIMQENKCPVIQDVTHALQQPNSASGVTGGRPQLISTIAKAAIAVGADGLFIETHPNPSEALSDGANMLPLEQMERLLEQLVKIRQALL